MLKWLTALFVLLSVSGTAAANDVPGLVTKKSAHSVSDTIDRLESVLKEKGVTIFARIDHAEGAKSVGQSLRPTTLLIFGNPRLGTPLMQSRQTAGLDLPLKALSYEAADGTVYLAYSDPTWMVQRYKIGDRSDVVDKITGALAGFTDHATR